MTMGEVSQTSATRLNAVLTAAGLERLQPALANGFEKYLTLLLRWNSRVNLTAIRNE